MNNCADEVNRSFMYFYMYFNRDILGYMLGKYFNKSERIHFFLGIGLLSWSNAVKLYLDTQCFEIAISLWDDNHSEEGRREVKDHLFGNFRERRIYKILYGNLSLLDDHMHLICKHKNGTAFNYLKGRYQHKFLPRMLSAIYKLDNVGYLEWFRYMGNSIGDTEPFKAPKCYKWAVNNRLAGNRSRSFWERKIMRAGKGQLDKFIRENDVDKEFISAISGTNHYIVRWAYKRDLLPVNFSVNFVIDNSSVVFDMAEMGITCTNITPGCLDIISEMDSRTLEDLAGSLDINAGGLNYIFNMKYGVIMKYITSRIIDCNRFSLQITGDLRIVACARPKKFKNNRCCFLLSSGVQCDSNKRIFSFCNAHHDIMRTISNHR